MCGIVGWLSNEIGYDTIDRRKFIEQALIMDTVRGGDSTGVFVVPRKDLLGIKPGWAKETSGGHEFVLSENFQNLFGNGKTADYKFAVGHNRSATIGGVSLETAHPFQEGPITLVHNGTVNDNMAEARADLGAKNDSHAICHLLGKYSTEDVIASLDGAFALVWYDNRDDSLNFVRNDKRPFHMAKSKPHDTIYFASEGEMLMWLNNRLSLKLMDIVQLKPAHWLKFKGLGAGLLVPEVKEVTLYKPKIQVVYNPADWENYTGTGSASTAMSGVTLPKVPASPTTYLPLDGGSARNGGAGTQIPAVLLPPRGATPTAQRASTSTKGDPSSVLALDLYDLELDPEQQVQFMPIQAEQISWLKRSPSYTVYGYLLVPTKRRVWARVDGVQEHTWDKASKRVWTVRPLGVTMLGWEAPCAVCRLCTSVTPAGTSVEITTPVAMPPAKEYDLQPLAVQASEGSKSGRTEQAKAYPQSSFIDKIEREIAAERAGIALDDCTTFPGPNHRSLDYTEWHRLTDRGCIGCNRVLSILKDAWSLEWVNDGRDPCCEACVERITAGELDLDDLDGMPFVDSPMPDIGGRDPND